MAILKIKPFSIDTAERFTFANANITGNIESGNANLGNLVTANFFSGNGSSLSSIAGANVTGQVANAIVAGTVYTAAQPNITSIGTLTSLTVSGNSDLGAVANVKISGGSNGYVLKTDGSGNLSWVSASSATGNANVGGSNTQVQFNNGTNLAGSANLTFDVTTNTLSATNFVGNGSGLTGIVASSGTATKTANGTSNVDIATASGNITMGVGGTAGVVTITTTGINVAGYINAGSGVITGNGSGLTSIAGANVTGEVAFAATANSVAGANVTGNVGNALNAYAVAGGNVSGQVANALVAGTVYTAAQPNITSVGTLTSVAVTGNLTAGNANITGTLTVGTITTAAGGSGNISGADVISANAFTASGNITAAFYLGNGSQLTGVAAASATKTANGTSNVDIVTANGNITMGVGGTGNVVIVTTTGVNVAGYITTTGNVTVGNIIGNGQALTGLAGANVTGNVGNALNAYAVAGANVSGQVANALVSGTVYTNAQPNITSVGTLSSLSVTGDISGANLTLTGNLIISGTTTTVNSTTTRVVDPIVEQGGVANGGTLNANDGKDRGTLLHYYDGAGFSAVDAFMGWDNSNGEFGFGSNVSVASDVVTFTNYGNVRANVYFGNGSQLTGVTATTATSAAKTANGTSNVDITTANGNITMGVGGVGNIVIVTTTGVNVAGTLNSTGNLTALNADLGNLATANHFTGNGSLLSAITGANVTGNVGNALNAYAVAGANVSGNVGNALNAYAVAGANVSGAVSSATTSGTVTTAAQPNITSTGTLTSLTVSGVTTLGAVANVKISGGSADYVLKTDGTGNLSWTALSSTTLVVDRFTGNGTWTMQTLSATPASVDYTIVAIGGVLQPRNTYSVLAAVITFSEAPPVGAVVEITTVTGGTGGGGGGGGSSYTYSAISANTSAVVGYKYIVNTATSNLTITLPASGTLGDEISIIDGTGNASTHAITVARNGGNIQGSASDMTVTTDRAAFTLAYYNATQGWLLTNV
jgi:hypothetical protein